MCTDFLVVDSDSSKVAVNGRSMEFGVDLQSQLQVRAPGEKFHSRASVLNPHGLTWTSKYGYVGMSGELHKVRALTDGMNTQGLSTGTLWMPGSKYPAAPKDPSKGLMPEQFGDWALGNFATVDEVHDALTSPEHPLHAELWHTEWLSQVVPVHFAVHDAKGHSMVVEFTDGVMHCYRGKDNPVGVLTNHPTFPTQLENLKSYVNLSPYDSEGVKFGAHADFKPHGCGSGMLGLPGDSTPPSRFVRTAYLKQYARPVTHAADACSLAFHLLNTVDIPKGVSRKVSKTSESEADDYTQWVVVKDLVNTVLYVRFYNSMTVQSVDLKKLNFAAAAGKLFQVQNAPAAIDITSNLK